MEKIITYPYFVFTKTSLKDSWKTQVFRMDATTGGKLDS
jgi:hypothetical protein